MAAFGMAIVRFDSMAAIVCVFSATATKTRARVPATISNLNRARLPVKIQIVFRLL